MLKIMTNDYMQQANICHLMSQKAYYSILHVIASLNGFCKRFLSFLKVVHRVEMFSFSCLEYTAESINYLLLLICFHKVCSVDT